MSTYLMYGKYNPGSLSFTTFPAITIDEFDELF